MSNFLDTEPKTLPPFSTKDFASDLLIFQKPPVNITLWFENFPVLFMGLNSFTDKFSINFPTISTFFLFSKKLFMDSTCISPIPSSSRLLNIFFLSGLYNSSKNLVRF